MTEKQMTENIHLFPKKLFYLAMMLSFVMLIVLSSFIYKTVRNFEDLHLKEIPVLEMSNTNIRLNESISKQFNILFSSEERETKEELLKLRNLKKSLLQNLETLNLKIQELGFTKDLYISRGKIIDQEREIFQLIKSNKKTEAKKLFIKYKLKQKHNQFNDMSQELIDSLAEKRKQKLNSEKRNLNLVALTSFITITVILLLWFYVYLGYSKSTKAQKKLSSDLENQRVLSFNNAKMASLGEMAAGIAHEINNPLAIIEVSASTLERKLSKEDALTEDVEKYILKIKNTVHRIASIIKSLKNMSRVSENDDFLEIDIQDMINDTLVLLQDKLYHNKIEVHIEKDPNVIAVNGKLSELSQVLINLVSNSADAIIDSECEERSISIKTKLRSNMVYIMVEDSGPGVPKDKISKIFDPFYTTKDIGKGTGLGLSLSKQIIENHRGEIFLDTTESNSTFVIKIPHYDHFHTKSA
jgi:signal transduction histidine kinase